MNKIEILKINFIFIRTEKFILIRTKKIFGEIFEEIGKKEMKNIWWAFIGISNQGQHKILKKKTG